MLAMGLDPSQDAFGLAVASLASPVSDPKPIGEIGSDNWRIRQNGHPARSHRAGYRLRSPRIRGNLSFWREQLLGDAVKMSSSCVPIGDRHN
jgi:hypothetical protein